MKNSEFVEECKLAKSGDIILRDSITFEELFNLKYPAEKFDFESEHHLLWYNFEIYTRTKRDYTMHVWNGHGANPENSEHICPEGSRVRIWMVSRMGDIGITDNLINPKGYDCRGINEHDLSDWEFIHI